MGGPAFGLGVTARGWSHKRLGVQFDLSRYKVSNPIDLGTMSSTEFGPSVLFSFNDHIADYTWLRPYVGAGLNFYRSSIAARCSATCRTHVTDRSCSAEASCRSPACRSSRSARR